MGPTKLSSISAFVPAYNEAANIERVIVGLHRALERVAHRHEVIVVLYEGCNDGTDSIVRRMMQSDDRLSLVLQPRERRGYGVALRMGIQAARYEYIFYTDADNQFDPAEIDKLAQLIDGCDLATGYRVNRQDPLARRVTARVYNWLVDALLGTGVRDVDCAFKLYRRSLFASMELTCDTGLIDPEIVSKARQAGQRVAEVGVSHYPRGGGEGHFEAGALGLGLPAPRVVLGVLAELWQLRGQLRG
jgi:glycosyltransferase involved in cell wall biosynthesis